MIDVKTYEELELHGDGRKVRDDSLPEHVRYQDLGCELSPSCLRCPLERCVFDTGGVNSSLVSRRDETLRGFRRTGAPIDSLAQHYGISRRSVFRALRRHSGMLDRPD